MPNQYQIPTSDILVSAQTDYYYSGLTDPISGGIRIYDPYSGNVTDYLRAGETEWEANLYTITGTPDGMYHTEDNLATLKLAIAVHLAANPPPTPDYRTLVTVTLKDNDDVQTPANDMLKGLISENYKVLRNFQYRDLLQRIPSLVLDGAGGAVPFQAEGQWYGYEFYFRYRSGTASLSLGTSENCISRPLWKASMEYGDYLDGSLTTEEFTYLFCALARQLKEAPYRYNFYDQTRGPEATVTRYREDGATYEIPEIYVGWGMNQWDARRYAYDRHLEHVKMREAITSVKTVRKPFRKPNFFDMVTDDVDDRVYPEVRPPFTVLVVPEPTVPFEYEDDET